MKLPKRLDEVESFKKFDRPEPGGYQMKVVAVTDGFSSSGKPMLTFELDVNKGEYTEYFARFPLRFYVTYNIENLPRMKHVLEAFLGSNPGLFTEKDFQFESFNERRLIGSTVGAILGNKMYLNKKGVAKQGHYVHDLISLKTLEAKAFAIPPDQGISTSTQTFKNKDKSTVDDYNDVFGK